MKEINKLKKGDYFKKTETTNIIWVYDGYNSSTRKYSAYKFDDINHYQEFKKGKQVFINFKF